MSSAGSRHTHSPNDWSIDSWFPANGKNRLRRESSRGGIHRNDPIRMIELSQFSQVDSRVITSRNRNTKEESPESAHNGAKEGNWGSRCDRCCWWALICEEVWFGAGVAMSDGRPMKSALRILVMKLRVERVDLIQFSDGDLNLIRFSMLETQFWVLSLSGDKRFDRSF